MSAYAMLSADRSGVYCTPGDVVPLRARADRSGAAWLEVDASSVHDKSALMSACARALAFPGAFGANWDALADALQDLSWRPAPAYVLHLRTADGLQPALGADWGRLVDVLETSAAYWAQRGKPFIALLDRAEDLPSWT